MEATPPDLRGGADTDPRTVVLAVAAARIGIGVGAMFMTRPALRLLGFSDSGPAAAALGKLAGGRDIALGALALLARDDAKALRTAALAGAAVDAADAVSLGGAAIRRGDLGLAGMLGGISGGCAAAAGLWAASRL